MISITVMTKIRREPVDIEDLDEAKSVLQAARTLGQWLKGEGGKTIVTQNWEYINIRLKNQRHPIENDE